MMMMIVTDDMHLPALCERDGYISKTIDGIVTESKERRWYYQYSVFHFRHSSNRSKIYRSDSIRQF